MDQLVSGSGLMPLRDLGNEWLTMEEQATRDKLAVELAGTGQGYLLATDMLAPTVYDFDVRIILDDSGSMECDMFGSPSFSSTDSVPWIDQTSTDDGYDNSALLARLGMNATTLGLGPCHSGSTGDSDAPNPRHRRWWFARDALRRWAKVYHMLGLDPEIYLLNSEVKYRCSDLGRIFDSHVRSKPRIPAGNRCHTSFSLSLLVSILIHCSVYCV
jgi:hypothetical protein